MSSTSSTGTVLSSVDTRSGAGAATVPAGRQVRHAARGVARPAGCAVARGAAARPGREGAAGPSASGIRLGVLREDGTVPTARTHLTARGRVVVVAGLVLLLLAAFSLGRTGAEGSTEVQPRVEVEQTTVLPGDSLWAVAKRLAPGQDPRPVVEQIRRLNGLAGAELQAGQQLLLPVAR